MEIKLVKEKKDSGDGDQTQIARDGLNDMAQNLISRLTEVVERAKYLDKRWAEQGKAMPKGKLDLGRELAVSLSRDFIDRLEGALERAQFLAEYWAARDKELSRAEARAKAEAKKKATRPADDLDLPF
jgi:hypothetical protein